MPALDDARSAIGTLHCDPLTGRPEVLIALCPPARAYPLAMGKIFDEIDERLRDWIYAQPLFFVATAPLAAGGHVNVSPKGPIGTLRVRSTATPWPTLT